jgi:hypothetical protein
LEVPSGVTLTLNGASVGGGFMRGAGTFVVTGGSALTGVTTAPSTKISVTGSATFTNFTNGSPLTIAGGLTAPTTFNLFNNQGSGAITVGAVNTVNASDFQTYGTLTINPAAITENYANTTLMTNTGSSPLFFNGGSRTFVGTPATALFPQNWPDPALRGTPTFVAGIDLHGQNAIVAGGLFVNNGYVLDSANGGAGMATIIADFGALVKGSGFFLNPIITQNGGRVQAGNSPGSVSFGRFVFGPGGVNNYVFTIDDATGAAGPSPDALGHVSGWGFINAIRHLAPGESPGAQSSGDFTWTATPASKLTVSLDTLVNPTTVGVDMPGPMDNFDPRRSYIWPAVEWAGHYAGPTDAATLDAATSFDASGFLNPIAGTFGWSLDTASQTLSLIYTPSSVPEPGTLGLIGLAAAGLVWRRTLALIRTT